MRIVYVLQDYMKVDGISVFVENVLREFVDSGHECWFVHERGGVLAEGLDIRIKVVATNGALDALGFVPDIVHINALWSPFAARALAWCNSRRVKYVVSPHGCLMPRVLKKGWLKKRIFYMLFLKKALDRCCALHCTGDGEISAVKALRIKARTFFAPLGCRIPVLSDVKSHDDSRIILFLSRISEEKGLSTLLDVWQSIPHNHYRIILAGPDWRGYREILEEKIRRKAIRDVEFVGLADEGVKDRLYRLAKLFVLPSPMENFSMVVLDALAYGIPVVTTKGTPWKVIQDWACGWWVRPNENSIRVALQDAIHMPESQLAEMGRRGRELAAEKYSWRSVARILLETYNGILQ